MSDEFGNEEVVFLKVDVDECPDAAAKYSVKAMPTFVSSVFCLLLLLSYYCCCCCCRRRTVFYLRWYQFFTHSIFDTFIDSYSGDLCIFLLAFISFFDDWIDTGMIICYSSLLRVVKLLKQSCKSLLLLVFSIHFSSYGNVIA